MSKNFKNLYVSEKIGLVELVISLLLVAAVLFYTLMCTPLSGGHELEIKEFMAIIIGIVFWVYSVLMILFPKVLWQLYLLNHYSLAIRMESEYEDFDSDQDTDYKAGNPFTRVVFPLIALVAFLYAFFGRYIF